jgi:hypothetical protein
MTSTRTTTDGDAAAQDRTAPPSRARLAGLGAAALAVTATFTVWRADSAQEILTVLAVLVPTVIGVYGFLLPRQLRHASAPNTAMTLAAIAGLLLLPAFWSGQSFVLGVAAAVVGWSGRYAATGSRRSIAALVIGVLAAIGYLAIYLVDWFLS